MTKVQNKIIVLSLLSTVISATAIAQIGAQHSVDYLFERNLRHGSSGQDVLELQKIFNSNPATKLADTGAGSPSSETTYFGPLTKAAAIKFQEFYTTEILTPVGLTLGTGFVGPSTRAHLDTLRLLQAESTVQEEQTSETSVENETFPSAESIFSNSSDENIYITGLSDYYVRPGVNISVNGFGFLPSGNTVVFGGIEIENVTLVDSGQLSFVVPELEPGIYVMYVKNSNDTSEEIDVVITYENPVQPTIDRVSPENISGGTKVILYGSGFTPDGNMVFTDGFAIRDLSSKDGLTIEFIYSIPVFDKSKFSQETLDTLGSAAVATLESIDQNVRLTTALEIFIGVVNANGRSNVVEAIYQ